MKRAWIWLLSAALLLGGCGSQDGYTDQNEEGGSTDGQKSMGRYLEEDMSLPEGGDQDYQTAMQALEDGSLAILGQNSGLSVSSDGGETWEKRDVSWLQEFQQNQMYITDLALAPSGAAAAVYIGDTAADDTEEDLSYSYLYADAEGNASDLEIPRMEYEIYCLWFGTDSRLYGCGLDGKVYRIDETDGSLEELLDTGGLVDSLGFTDRYLIAFSSEGVSLYDLENGTQEEDKVLNDFIMDDRTVSMGLGTETDNYTVLAVQGEQADVIYVAFSKGLYRHVIGGAAMEQVIDGNLTSLGDPQMGKGGLAVLADDEFAVLYPTTKLCRYVYDGTIPTVPEEEIRIYSLTEDYTVRQAVSLFQREHPEVYVRYEMGMSGSDGMTEEDAIRNLNTELLSGNGPDLLVLDGLPGSSYRRKGVLADVSGLVDSMAGESALLSNIVDAFREDGAVYSLPLRFRLPMILGGIDAVNQVTDLKTLADVQESLRQEHPEGSILGFMTEEEALYTLGLVSSSAWTDENGAVDEEALTEFLTQARRIYQTEAAGFSAEELEDYVQNYREAWSTDVSGEGHYYANASASALDVAMGQQVLAVGSVSGMSSDFNLISTVAGQGDSLSYGAWNGQVQNGFLPVTQVGITEGAADRELAQEFFCFLFSEQLQDLELPGGFPVNEASFDRMAAAPSGQEASSIAVAGDSGETFSLDIVWASEEDFQKLKEISIAVDTLCTGDSALEQAVYEVGPDALNGKMSVEDAVGEICRRAAIYLAE